MAKESRSFEVARIKVESHKYLHLFESTLVVATNLVGKE
jgi:hypothetical protein